MKIKVIVSTFLLTFATALNSSAYAQMSPPQINPAPTTSEDFAKTQTVQKLLEITGSKKLYKQMVLQIFTSLKTTYPRVPAKIWDTFAAEINPDELLNKLVPIYSKYYSNQELQELVEFYQTPIGQKTIRILPELSRESAIIGIKLGQEAAERAIKKLKAEGYIAPHSSKK